MTWRMHATFGLNRLGYVWVKWIKVSIYFLSRRYNAWNCVSEFAISCNNGSFGLYFLLLNISETLSN